MAIFLLSSLNHKGFESLDCRLPFLGVGVPQAVQGCVCSFPKLSLLSDF